MTIFRCIDFETTGIPSAEDKHAIVEIGAIDLIVTEGSMILSDEAFTTLCDPGRPIPHEAMAVHHITDDMVKGATGSVADLGNPDFFVAHNADYERQFFPTAIPFICTYKAALRLWPEATSHSLQFLRYHLALPVDANLCQPPHRAGPDAYLGAVLMRRILQEGRATIDEMVRWSDGHALLPRCPLFKHKGKKWEDVPTDYLDWIVNKPNDCTAEVKANARLHLKARAA